MDIEYYIDCHSQLVEIKYSIVRVCYMLAGPRNIAQKNLANFIRKLVVTQRKLFKAESDFGTSAFQVIQSSDFLRDILSFHDLGHYSISPSLVILLFEVRFTVICTPNDEQSSKELWLPYHHAMLLQCSR